MQRDDVGGLLALILLLLLLSTACAAPAPRVLGGHIDRTADPSVWLGPSGSLHPHTADADITAALFAPMVAIDGDTRRAVWGDDAPGALLAEIRTDDLRRWELVLKPGLTWQDGSPITTEDVLRGWQAATEAGLPQQAILEDVRALDKQQVNVFLSGPYASFPELLAAPAFLPLPGQATSSPADFQALPVGSGPYQVMVATEEQLILDAWPAHPVGATTPRVVVRRTADPDASDDLLVGVDGRRGPSPVREGQQVMQVPGSQFAYLGLPLRSAPYDDVRVRNALSLAIDRQTLAESVLGGAVQPADRLLGPGQERSPDVTCAACRFDPELAAATLPADFAGPLTLWFTEDPLQQPVIDFLAESWRRVLGLEDILLASAPPGELLAQLDAGAVDGPFRLTWSPDVPAATRTLQPLFGDAGEANDGPYVDQRVDDLLDRADRTGDPSERTSLQARAESLILADLPVIPLWFSAITIVADPDVTVRVDGLGRLDWSATDVPG